MTTIIKMIPYGFGMMDKQGKPVAYEMRQIETIMKNLNKTRRADDQLHLERLFYKVEEECNHKNARSVDEGADGGFERYECQVCGYSWSMAIPE
jgi:transposase-like protein